MNSRTVFQLKIWHQPKEESCFFALFWDGGRKNLVVSQPYYRELQQAYQDWQRQYLRYYGLFSTPTIPNSGSINLVSVGDRSQDLREVEQRWLTLFQRWLGEGAACQIERKIQDELTHLVQNTPQLNRKTKVPVRLEIFLSSSPDLVKFPWEMWVQWLIPKGLPQDSIRLIRTSLKDVESDSPPQPKQPRKPRILATLGYDPKLPLEEDWKIIQSLRSVADVERVEWETKDNDDQIRGKVLKAISDHRGWDVLIFGGHSEETENTGGIFQLTPSVCLSISDIEDRLTQAYRRGLQLAIFNSCSGLSIAHSLIELGLQVVVMRERIDNTVAQRFLKQFCQQFRLHKDVHTAVLTASQYLQSAERISSPSAYLLPSFFSPPDAVPFRLEPFGWKKIIQQWKPNKREAIALSFLIPLSFLVPVQDFLLDLRYLSQAIYRQAVSPQTSVKSPPILLIEVDQASINDLVAKGVKTDPIDRGYLADIMNHLSNFKSQVIGVEYLLDSQGSGEEKFARSLESIITNQKPWFVFATKMQGSLPTHLVNAKWSLFGHSYLEFFDLQVPNDPTCSHACPFAYLLAIAHQLNQKDLKIQPDTNNSTLFKVNVSEALEKNQVLIPLPLFPKKLNNILELRTIADFSLSPNTIYQKVSAKDFLQTPVSNQKMLESIPHQVVIIASGDYDRLYKKDYPLPLAQEYWCNVENWQYKLNKECSNRLTKGEVYATHGFHYLKRKAITLVPDLYFVLMAVIAGKGFKIITRNSAIQNYKKIILIALAASILYSIICLNIYLLAEIAIPIFLPSLTFGLYLLPILRRKFNE